jgi:hypothetical protein
MLVVGVLLSWAGVGRAQTPAALLKQYGLTPGMTITKDNAHLIKDLVPEATYRRTVAGDYVFTIGTLDPPDLLEKLWDPEFYAASKRNAGKYEVTEGGIIDKATGKRPWPMPPGYPFPEIDFAKEDPQRVGAKIWWNVFAAQGTVGNIIIPQGMGASFAHGSSRWDRYFILDSIRQYVDFRRDLFDAPQRPIMFQEMSFFRQPADAFGSATLTWRWADPKKWDSVWSYSPANRRVRRTTAANRSDGVLGTEFVNDDGLPGYNGKIEMMEWKYVGEGVTLMPVPLEADQELNDYIARLTYKAKPSAAYSGAFNERAIKFPAGYMEGYQQYAPWWIITLWVPVPAVIVEGYPKDPYYNYGRQVYWIAKNNFAPIWKIIYNRSGEYWRTMWLGFEYPRLEIDGKEQVIFNGTLRSQWDDLSNRGTPSVHTSALMLGKKEGEPTVFRCCPDFEMLSLSRFLEYGK